MFKATENESERSGRENRRRKRELWDRPGLSSVLTPVWDEGSKQGRWKECLHSKKFLVRGLLTSCCTPHHPSRPSSSPSHTPSVTCSFSSRFPHWQTHKCLEAVRESWGDGEREQVSNTESARERVSVESARYTCMHIHTHTLCFVTYHRVWFPNKMTLVKVCLIESWFKRSGSPTFCQGETSASCSPFHHCILPFCTALWTKPAEETCHNDAG